ncbi:MAG: RagB/SusD family nutrient uptake outer membrane protein [Parcubacteria group bacterium]|nr:RagB/SusD family nutrient uptake outer membrane protein [Parcubacteria group bacterium]
MFVAISIASCTKLDEKIFDEEMGTSLIDDPANAPGLVNPAYASLRNLNEFWGTWGLQEATTDEAMFPTRGTDWYDNGIWQQDHLHTWSADHGHVSGAWNVILQGISRANTGIYYLKEFPSTTEIDGYIVELRFLKAYYVYLCNDFYGQTPYRTWDETDYSTPPIVLSREEATQWLFTELKEIIPLMKTKSELPYGRATKAAAQTLLAKVYLNQEVYIGTAAWSDVITQCDAVINSSDYTIAPDYWAQFQYDNPDVQEAIFTFIRNDNYDLGGGGVWVNFTLHYHQTFGNYTSLWNGGCITKTFWDSWENTDDADVRKYDNRIRPTTGLDQGFLVGQQYSVDGTALDTREFDANGNPIPLIFVAEVNLTNASEAQGIRCIKYAPNPQTTRQFDAGNDFYAFRISDVYLMRAEAKFRSGDEGGARDDVNAIRSKRNATPRAALTLDEIYDERGYELFWEGKRRQDMIRFGHFNDAYSEKPVTPAYTCIFPIPQSALDVNPNLVQNTGY